MPPPNKVLEPARGAHLRRWAKMYPLAQSRYRVAAGIVNLVFGTLPLSATNLMFTYGAAGSWTRDEVIFRALAVGLALIQLLIVFKMQGSPGYVFAGLRIQLRGGAPLTSKALILRSVPHLLGLVLVLSMPRSSGSERDILVVGLLGICSGAVLMFLLMSASVALLTGASIIDRYSGTEVVKVYSINQ
jgi:uncharacterized RDD family membrane protein YckC